MLQHTYFNSYYQSENETLQVTDGKWLQRPGKVLLSEREIRMTCAVRNVIVFDFFINEVPAGSIPG